MPHQTFKGLRKRTTPRSIGRLIDACSCAHTFSLPSHFGLVEEVVVLFPCIAPTGYDDSSSVTSVRLLNFWTNPPQPFGKSLVKAILEKVSNIAFTFIAARARMKPGNSKIIRFKVGFFRVHPIRQRGEDHSVS